MYSLPSNPLSTLNVGNEGSGRFSAESLDPIYRSAVIIDDFIIIISMKTFTTSCNITGASPVHLQQTEVIAMSIPWHPVIKNVV